MTRRLVALLAASLITLGLATQSGASDVDLGSPTTIEELLASPEYIEDEHGDVARLYRAFLGRTPDVAGLVYWIDRYEDGAPMIDLAWSFSASTEFRAAYGSNLDNQSFLTVVYQNVLGRGYDQAGFDYWLGQMAGGLSRPATVLWIVAGDEFRANYPFAGTFPDFTSALVKPTDQVAINENLPIHETDRLSLTPAEVDELEPCSRLRLLHPNLFGSFVGSSDGSRFFSQEVYAFSDPADAAQVMTNHRRLVTQCPEQVIDYPDGAVLTARYALATSSMASAQPLGDDWLAIDATWTWQNGSTFSFTLIVVRNQNVVTINDFTVRGTAAVFGNAYPFAKLTSERMDALLAS